MQHPKCCTKNMTVFKFEPTLSNMLQHNYRNRVAKCLQHVVPKQVVRCCRRNASNVLTLISGYYCLLFEDFFIECNSSKTKEIMQATGSPILRLQWVMLKNDGRYI